MQNTEWLLELVLFICVEATCRCELPLFISLNASSTVSIISSVRPWMNVPFVRSSRIESCSFLRLN